MKRLLFSLTFVATALSAQAQTTPTPDKEATEKEARATELVRQLGDISYRKREAASNELATLGRFAYKALVSGTKDPDAEIWLRCSSLLPEARKAELTFRIDRYLADKEGKLTHDLPMMKKFQAAVGDDATSKAIFVELVKNHSTILDEIENKSKDGQRLIDARLGELFGDIYSGRRGGIGSYNGQEMAGLLFLMTQNDDKPTLQPYMYGQIIGTDPMMRLIREDKQGGPYRKIILSFLEARGEEQVLNQMMYQFTNLGMKEAVPVLLKCLDTKTFNQYTKAQILGVIGGMGGKEHVDGVKKHLTDDTFVQNFFAPGKPGVGGQPPMGNVLIKDIALACAIHMEGKDPKDYGFSTFQKPAANQMLQYYNLGFMTDEERSKAFEKYTGKKEEPKKKEDPKKEDPAKPGEKPIPLPAPDLPIDNIKIRGK